VAAKRAAIETIRAGYDRYVIAGAQSQNNVNVTQMPGQARTSGTTTYVPGSMVQTRRLRQRSDRAFSARCFVRLFRNLAVHLLARKTAETGSPT